MNTTISGNSPVFNNNTSAPLFSASLNLAGGDDDKKTKADKKTQLERRTKEEEAGVKEDPVLGKYITRYGIRIYLKYRMKPCDNLSNNCNQRPVDSSGQPQINGVMLHNTVVPFDEAVTLLTEGKVTEKKNVDGTVTKNRNGASANYIIDKNGNVFLLVDEEERSWHAGAGSFNGKERANDGMIGVELEGEWAPTNDQLTDDCTKATNFNQQPAFSKKQIDAYRKLAVGMKDFWNIEDKNFVYHSDYKFYDPNRIGNRCDPGSAFPAEKLAKGKRGLLPWQWFSKTDKVGLWPVKIPVDKNGATYRHGQTDADTPNGRGISDDQKLLMEAGYTKIAARDDKGALIKGSEGELTVTGKYDDVTDNARIAFMLHYMPDGDFSKREITPQMRALLLGLIEARKRNEAKRK